MIRERDSEINLLERKVNLLGMKGKGNGSNNVEVKVTRDSDYGEKVRTPKMSPKNVPTEGRRYGNGNIRKR